MVRRLAIVVVLAAAAPLLSACREGTVALLYTPSEGDELSFRYEIDATITQSLDGLAPTVSRIHTSVEADQEVLEVSAAGVRAAVTLQRDGGAPRTSQVRLDDAGTLQGVDLIEGQPTTVFGLDDLAGVLPTVALPDGRLSPGDRWSVDDSDLVGEGRLVRLGVIDGEDVAFVASELTQAIAETATVGATSAALDGELRATSTTAYDLRDGSLRRATTRARGAVDARIAPPPGVDAAAVVGTITYDVRVRVVRLR